MPIVVPNPKTGEIFSTHELTPLDSMPSIFKAAREAQKVWGEYSFKKRSSIVKKVKDLITQNRDEILRVISCCSGKTKTDALATEVLTTIMAVDWYTNNAEKVLRESKIPTGHILFSNKSSYATYVPFGVVGIVSPWNYPFSIPVGEILMGLMAGNAIILKVASNSIPVGIMIEKIFTSIGLPQGLFHHVIINGSAIPRVFFNPNDRVSRVDKLFFTGSVPVGKELMRDASETLTPLSLELGGNDAAIVTENADLERAAQGCIWAGYQNAGCSCGGVERVYVHESVYQKFLDIMKKYTEALTHGNDDLEHEVQIGALATKKQVETVKLHLEDALSKGAKIVAQSKQLGDIGNGFYFPATLLANVTEDMLMMRDETFGPIIPIISYKNIEDAIAAANNTDLGLTTSIWDNSRARHKYARKLESGVVTINDHLYTHGRSELAWRGFKNSGIGSTHGSEGLKEMCQLRIIDDERLPFIKRNIWYYPHGTQTYEGLLNVVNYLNPSNFFTGIISLIKMIPFALRMFTSWKIKKDTKQE